MNFSSSGFEIAIKHPGQRHVFRSFSRLRDRSSRDLEKRFRSLLKEFYKNHVIPFAQFDPAEKPWLDLIVAVQRGEAGGMWVTDCAKIRHRRSWQPSSKPVTALPGEAKST